MRYAPVFLPEEARLNDRASMTFLRHYDLCARAGYLQRLYNGQASTVEMQRGRALHTILERATRTMISMREPMIPREVVKVICDEVFAETPVPVSEHDFVRESCARWADEVALDPSRVVAVETLLQLQVAGFTVRCRVDFAELREDGAVCYVADYKSGRSAPSFDDVSRKRADGSLAAKNFQLVLYALALAHGVSVREEPCTCAQPGVVLLGGVPMYATDEHAQKRLDAAVASELSYKPCEICGDTGRHEITEPFPLAARAQHFDLEFVFPGIEDREGRMLRRPVSLTRIELQEYMASLVSLLYRVKHSEETGDWPAVVSDEACGQCPAPSECPIPREVRDHRGEIQSVAQAAEALEVADRISSEASKVRAEVRAFAKREGVAIRFGRDKVADFSLQESERVDKEAMRAAMAGVPFEDFVKVVQSTPFRTRTMTPDELAEEAQDGND